jgi:hypothetical protein
MIKIKDKNLQKIILITSFILLNLIIIYGIGSVLSFFNRGANRVEILHLEAEPIETYLPKVNWITPKNLEQKIDSNALKKIEKHYLYSILTKNKAMKTNSIDYLKDFYTENKIIEFEKIINFNKQNKINIESTTIEHHITINYYSEAGTLVVFTDEKQIEITNYYKDKNFIYASQDTVAYKNIMLLEDGFWRIRQSKKIKYNKKIRDTIIVKPSIYTVKKNKIYKNDTLIEIKGINYYPQDTPWNMFGEKFDEKIISKDFKLISDSKLNTIRIFIPFEEFGKANINKEKLNRLKKVMEISQKQNLNVVVTLFDFYGDYSLESWTLTHRHAEKIINELKEFDNILAWDIKNEPDLDFKNRGKHNVEAWLASVIQIIKKNTNQLVTIGYSNIESSTILEKELDFISFHYYDRIEEFENKYIDLTTKTKKPILLQEFGLSSNRSLINWWGNSEKDQEKYFQKMQNTLKKNHINFISWTLYDFKDVPDAVAGSKFWVKNKQKNFGFIDKNGIKKASYLYISN